MTSAKTGPLPEHTEGVIAAARRAREEREQGYRARALQMYPWVCGRCARTFERKNLHELTVHHRDHNHDNNPEDGSNWELLCLYCHDNEHQRQLEVTPGKITEERTAPEATHQPFAELGVLLRKREDDSAEQG
jgi:predicted HNH restriction endonuclease